MTAAFGVRIGWSDLPAHVQRGIENILGGSVVSSMTQRGGFSPGTADRVQTEDGRRAFVKAVSAEANMRSAQLHRQEAVVLGQLPPNVPAPRLIGIFDDDPWVALIIEDVRGRHPDAPWTTVGIARTVDALRAMVAEPVPSSLLWLPDASDEMADDLTSWDRVAEAPPAQLDSWVAAHLHELRRLGRHALGAVQGDRLVHNDLRADNILLTEEGDIRIVDWPAAVRGAGWFDTLTLLINVGLYGGHDIESLAAESVAADACDVTAVLAGLAGYFTHQARLRPPPGLPTVRAFQDAQARVTLSWLASRIG